MDIRPGLGVILVGNRPDSATYVRMKRRACDKLGIYDHLVQLPERHFSFPNNIKKGINSM